MLERSVFQGALGEIDLQALHRALGYGPNEWPFPLCYFCETNWTYLTSDVIVRMRKEIKRTAVQETADDITVLVESEVVSVRIPRCPSCRHAQRVGAITSTILAVVTLLAVAIAIKVRTFVPGEGFKDTPWNLPVSIVAALAVSGVSNWLVRNCVGRKGAPGAKSIKNEGAKGGFPAVKRLGKQGFRFRFWE